MKQTITKLALAALAFGTPGCSDDDSPGPNRGGASESQELTLTPIGQLNQGADEINSHADVTARSSVKMNYRSYVNLGQSVTGNDNPNYARIKKLSDGSYILFNHYGGQGNANGFDIYYATSPDLENWTGRGLFSNAMSSPIRAAIRTSGSSPIPTPSCSPTATSWLSPPTGPT